jgi:DNA primase large subunit
MLSLQELQYCARYPFSSRTKELVRWFKFDLEDMDLRVLEAGKNRALAAINYGKLDIEAESNSEELLVTQILSYPLAKILVALTRNSFFAKKYAAAEAEQMGKFLENEETHLLRELAKDFEVPVDNELRIPFQDYLNAIPQRDEYKLVNTPLHQGRVYLSRRSLIAFLKEKLRSDIENDLKKVPVDLPGMYREYAREIKAEAQVGENLDLEDLGEVRAEAFPPCVKRLVARAKAGEKLGHQARFVLATFLTNVGMKTGEIVKLYSNTSNFDEGKTRYYVEYSAGKRGSGVKYTAPGCSKMVSYGLCVNKDALCNAIKHPLTYYAKKKRRGKRRNGI